MREWKKLLEEINTEGLTADCFRRKFKMKTVQPGTEQNYEVEEECRRN
jgi:hypothetical protein